jgi:hypothetical protein
MSGTRLSQNERTALNAWMETEADFGFLCFKAVGHKSGLPSHLIRRTVRSLARKGLLQFAKGLTDEEGEFYGSGYGLTAQGREVLNMFEPTNQTEDAA